MRCLIVLLLVAATHDEAIAALLTQRNIEEAAKSIGIGANTLLR